jgi:hypothetical protein
MELPNWVGYLARSHHYTGAALLANKENNMHPHRSMSPVLAGLSLLAAPLAVFVAPMAQAAVPDPCTFVTLAEVNAITGGAALKSESRKTGNQAACVFLDQAKSAVYTLDIEEDPDPKRALKDVLSNTEKQHKKPGKPLPGVGDQAAYIENMRVVYAAKGKFFICSYFAGGKYNTEANIAKLSEAVIKRVK